MTFTSQTEPYNKDPEKKDSVHSAHTHSRHDLLKRSLLALCPGVCLYLNCMGGKIQDRKHTAYSFNFPSASSLWHSATLSKLQSTHLHMHTTPCLLLVNMEVLTCLGAVTQNAAMSILCPSGGHRFSFLLENAQRLDCWVKSYDYIEL